MLSLDVPVKKFDLEMYQAALAYYKLPPGYNRTFTPLFSGSAQEKVRCDAQSTSEGGRAVWVQPNLPHDGFPVKVALSKDIAVFQNMMLDFEYPEEPYKTVEIGLVLARRLVELGLVEAHPSWPLYGKPGMPVELTGAGCHLCLPFAPLQVEELGGALIVDRAVEGIVERFIKPEFEKLVEKYEFNRQITVHAYDIGHIFSFPGTWRPVNFKERDCKELRAGYFRRWYRESEDLFSEIYPVRRESQALEELIRQECAMLVAAEHKRETWTIKYFEPGKIVPDLVQLEFVPPVELPVLSAEEEDAASPDLPGSLLSPYSVIDTSHLPPAEDIPFRAEDEPFMRKAIEQAELARQQGEPPFGTVIAGPEGDLVAGTFQRTGLNQDPTAHSEILALRLAGLSLGSSKLEGCTLYTTIEPCLMCLLFSHNAGIARIVYAVARKEFDHSTQTAFLDLSAKDAAYWINLQPALTAIEIVEGVLRQEFLTKYFNQS